MAELSTPLPVIACCEPEKQAECCAQSAKAKCCPPGAGDCGCQAAGEA